MYYRTYYFRTGSSLKAAIEDLKTGRLQAGWEKLEHCGVIKESPIEWNCGKERSSNTSRHSGPVKRR
jgi:hypothetical protein